MFIIMCVLIQKQQFLIVSSQRLTDYNGHPLFNQLQLPSQVLLLHLMPTSWYQKSKKQYSIHRMTYVVIDRGPVSQLHKHNFLCFET